MHVEHLEKSDVILNHKQTEDLKKHGKASGKGKLVGGDSALALGTLANGTNAYSGGMFSGGGGFNEANYTTFQERAGLIDDTVDGLDDLNDGLGDAGDSAGDLGDALDSAAEQVEHSSQVIDLIERRLKYFADRTKKIADQMQEYMSASTKRNLISNQINAVLDEIYANSRATTAYREEANKTARDFKYYGQDEGYIKYIQEQTDAWKAQMAGFDSNSEEYKSMQPQLDALNNQLNELKNQKNEYHIDLASEIDLDALRRGDYRLEEIDTSTQRGQALYDAAQDYMNKYDKSVSADQNIDTLSDQLRDLFSQMIQLPFDELSKSLNKLENTLQTLTGLADASAKGESTVKQLNKILEETFGPEKAKKYFNSAGKPFQAANREIDKALKKQKQQVEANDQAYESSVNTKKDLQRRLKDAKRRKKNAGGSYSANDLFTSGTDSTAHFSTGSDIDGLFTAGSGSSSGSADSIADAKKAEVEIRELEDAIKEADEKMKEQLEATKQSAIEYAQAVIDSVRSKLSNIDAYYSSLSDWQGTLAKELETNRDYMIQIGSYMKDGAQISSSYADQISIYDKEISILGKNIAKQKKTLDKAVADGIIEMDSMEYHEAATRIKELEMEQTNLRSTQQNLYKEMVNIPAEKYSEAINKIEQSYVALNTAMSKNLLNSRSTQRAMARAAKNLQARTGYQDQYSKYNVSDKTFEGQRIALEEEVRKSQEEYEKAIERYKESKKLYEEALKTGDEGNIKSAKEALDESTKVMNEAMGEAVNTEIQNAIQAVQNIDAFYSSLYNHYETLASVVDKNRQVQEKFGRQMDKNGDLITDVKAITESYTQQINYLSNAQAQVNQDIIDTRAEMERVSSTIGKDTEDYRKLEDELLNLQNKSYDLTISIQDLGDAWRKELMKPFEESIKKFETLRQNFSTLNGLISDEMKLTRDGEWTQMGVVSLTLDMADYTNAQRQMEAAMNAYNEVERQHRENKYMNDEEYLEESQAARQELLSALSSVNSAKQTLINDHIKRYQTEISYIKELIDAQSKELQKRKEIADYEKNMHKKNLAIQDIESQIRALQGLTDLESKQKLARLQAQKKEMTDERDETVQNHVYDLRQQGLSDLSSDLDKSLEIYTKELQVNLEQMHDVISVMSDNLSERLEQTNADLSGYLNTYGVKLTTQMLTGQQELTKENATQEQHQSAIKEASSKMESYLNGLYTESGKQNKLLSDYQSEQAAREQTLIDQNNVSGVAWQQRSDMTDTISTGNTSLKTALDTDITSLGTTITTDLTNLGITITSELDGIKNPVVEINNYLSKEKKNLEDAKNKAEKAQKVAEDAKIKAEKEAAKAKDSKDAGKIEQPKNTKDDGWNAPVTGVTHKTNTPGTLINENVAKPATIDTKKPTATTVKSGGLTAVNVSAAADDSSITSETKEQKANAKAIVELAFSSYKDFGYTKKKALVDDIYARKKITKPKSGPKKILEAIENWNSSGRKTSQATIKKLINKQIDSTKSGLAKYASGTFSARSGLAQVFEQGPEIITTPKGTFIPFAGGEGVVPAKETANLMKLAHAMESGKLQLQMPDMSSYKIPEVKQNVTNNSEIHIDSLITINGNADQNTVDQIRQIAQQLISDKRFQENVTQFVSQRQARDARMSGMRSGIK